METPGFLHEPIKRGPSVIGIYGFHASPVRTTGDQALCDSVAHTMPTKETT